MTGSADMTWRLVIDTATRRTVVAVGQGRVVAAAVVVETRHHHGTYLLTGLTSVLAEAGIGMAQVAAIGVGTGPGSFTGLRVGLATAKTLAAMRHLPIVGLPTDTALRQAAGGLLGAAAAEAAVLLPAGARDHYLGLPGADSVLVPPGSDMAALIGHRPLVAVDVAPDAEWLVPLRATVVARGLPDPLDLGRSAADGLPPSLLELLDTRLARAQLADVATLVPRYVALPRGIAAVTAAAADAPDTLDAGEGTWSPGYR